ncbi:MAG: YncE family protein [Gemmatimonadota bacterium]
MHKSSIRRPVLAVASLLALAACDEAERLTTNVKVARIKASPETIVLRQGEQAAINVELFDADGLLMPGAGVSFASMDTLVMTVTQTGVIRANRGNGNTQIIVAANGVATTVQVSATQVLASVVLLNPPSAVPQLDSVQLQAQAQDVVGHPITGSRVSWFVGERDRGDITFNGLFRASAQTGELRIGMTATHDGRTVTGSAALVVRAVAAQMKGLPAVVTVGEGSSTVLSPTVLDRGGDVMAPAALQVLPADTTLVRATDDGVIYSVGGQGTTMVTVRSDAVSRQVPVWVTAWSSSSWNKVGAVFAHDMSDLAAADHQFIVGRMHGPPTVGDWRDAGRSATMGAAAGASAVALTRDGRISFMALVARDAVASYDMAARRQLWRIEGAASALAVSIDGATLFYAGRDGEGGGGVVALDARGGRELWRGPQDWAGIRALELIESRRTAVVLRQDMIGTLHLDTRGAREVPLAFRAGAMRASPDGTELWLTVPGGNAIQVLRTSDYSQVRRIGLPCTPADVAHSPDGREAYVSCAAGVGDGGGLLVLERRGTLVARVVLLSGSPGRIAVSPDGRTLLVGNGAGRVDVLR